MKLVQKANRQLRVADDLLQSYVDKGYKAIETADEPEQNSEKFQCPYCDHKPYKTQEGLNNHIKDKHPEQNGADDNG